MDYDIPELALLSAAQTNTPTNYRGMFTSLNTPVTAPPDRIVRDVRTQLNQKEATRMDDPLSRSIAVRRRGAALVLAAATTMVALFLAACGGGSTSGSSGTSSLLTQPVDTSKQAKRGGTMKWFAPDHARPELLDPELLPRRSRPNTQSSEDE